LSTRTMLPDSPLLLGSGWPRVTLGPLGLAVSVGNIDNICQQHRARHGPNAPGFGGNPASNFRHCRAYAAAQYRFLATGFRHPRDPHVEHDRPGFDVFGFYEAGYSHGGNDDVSAAKVILDVAGSGMR